MRAEEKGRRHCGQLRAAFDDDDSNDAEPAANLNMFIAAEVVALGMDMDMVASANAAATWLCGGSGLWRKS